MSVTTCPVLRPTSEEFKDFRKYLATIDKNFDEGIVKVIPPKEFVFTRRDYEKLDLMLPHFYEQHIRRATEDNYSGKSRRGGGGGGSQGAPQSLRHSF